MKLTHLKWIAIVGPVAFLVVVGYLVRGPFHEELHEFPGYLYVLAGVTVGVSAFSFLVFGVIERVERRVVEQNEHLSALLAVARAGSSSLNLADVLDSALAEILSVTTAEIGEIWLVKDGTELVLARQRGTELDAVRERTHLRIGQGLPGLAAESGSPVIVHNLVSDPDCVRELASLGFEGFYAQPLVWRGATVGVLAVASRSSAALQSSAERRLLEGIGEQLAIAIENSRLHERVLDAAVLEERMRLAHELHDGLAQVLGYVNAQTLAIRKLLSSGRIGEAEEQIGQLREAARRSYTNVREAILGLRSTSHALLPSLDSYLSDFGRMTGMQYELNVGTGVDDLSLPPSTEIQLIRIAQEALSNVRKHSRASTAIVNLAVHDGSFTVEVLDDGRGFDADRPMRTGWPHFGLQTMRERAQAIGGTLELWSTPGSGTRVTTRVPLSNPGR